MTQLSILTGLAVVVAAATPFTTAAMLSADSLSARTVSPALLAEAVLNVGPPETGDGEKNKRPCDERVPEVAMRWDAETLNDGEPGFIQIADCGPAPLQIALTPGSLTFVAGPNSQSTPAPQVVTVSSTTMGTAWTATTQTASGGTWLSVTPPSGVTAGTVSVSINTSGLSTLGTYQGTVRITATGAMNSPQILPVTLTIANLPDTQAPSQPTNLTATTVSVTRVDLTWTGSDDNSGGAGIKHYEIHRKVDTGVWALLATATTTNYSDMAVTAGKAYVYRVRAVDQASIPNRSGFGTTDLATTAMFTDDPLTPWTTVDKLMHLTELRQAVNAVRTTAGLGPFSGWTDPSPTTSTPIKKVHIEELRTRLNEARTQSVMGLAAVVFTDPALSTSTLIKKVHVEELRLGVK